MKQTLVVKMITSCLMMLMFMVMSDKVMNKGMERIEGAILRGTPIVRKADKEDNFFEKLETKLFIMEAELGGLFR